MPYPHGPACRCPATSFTADEGLLRYTRDCDHYEQLVLALTRIADEKPTATLRVLTTDRPPDGLVPLPADAKPCSGEMVCDCPSCVAERTRRVRNGVRQVAQPWDGRSRRRRVAA